MNAIIFDLETTGLLKPQVTAIEEQPHIIEIGAIFIQDGDVRGELSQLINPKIPIPEIITKITGITGDDLTGMPTFNEYLPQLEDFFYDVNMLIAHNAPFDIGVLKVELERSGVLETFPIPPIIIDTIQEYKEPYAKFPKMTELYKKFLGKDLKQSHRALDDCHALLEILASQEFFNIGEK